MVPSLPQLDAGEIMHVGKSATFGLGRYEMHNVSTVIPVAPIVILAQAGIQKS